MAIAGFCLVIKFDGWQLFLPAPLGILAFYILPSPLVHAFVRYKVGRLLGDDRMRGRFNSGLRCAWHPNPPFSPRPDALVTADLFTVLPSDGRERV